MIEQEAYDKKMATLSSEGDMTIFSFGDRRIKFAAPKCLRRYVKIKNWDNGLITVNADYGKGIVEEYVDVTPVLTDLMIPKSVLKNIENVEIKYAGK